MSLAQRMGWPERHQSVGKWPRLSHMFTHLDAAWPRPEDARTLSENRALLPLLLEGHTSDEIAAAMGKDWQGPRVRMRGGRIAGLFGLSGRLTHSRLALVGIAAGVRPCVCGE